MKYRFGVFEVEPAIFACRKDGESIALEPQVFNLLLFFIENRDRVLSREEVFNAVWNGRVVSEATLSSRIFALRRALGDTGEVQAIIQTVRGRGFRFLADVTTDHRSSELDSARHEKDGETVVSVDSEQPAASTFPACVNLPVLAILPFKKASDGLDDYFCDGLTEDIIFNLTQFRELRVVASGSSFQFRARTLALSDIARKLGVSYIVDGSVRRYDDDLRVAVQLIDPATGVSLWADRYDRKMVDVFSVQNEIAYKISAALGVNTQNAELARALFKNPTELDAYDCLLHARRYTATLYDQMHADARNLLEKAIGLDPNYADTHALLANVYLAEYRFNANPKPNSIERALACALKAVQLDPQNAYAHCWLAIVHYFQKDMGKFEFEIQRALVLNPYDPEILAEVGHYLCYKGELERGIVYTKRAQALNPLHPGWYHFSHALLSYHQGRYEDMLLDVQHISMPSFFWTHLLNAAALGRLGSEQAAVSLQLMREAKPGVQITAEMKKWIVSQERYDNLLLGLQQAGFVEQDCLLFGQLCL